MRKIITLSIFALLLVIISCKKDDKQEAAPSVGCKPLKAVFNDGKYYEYSYAENKLKSTKYFSASGRFVNETIFTYDDQNYVTKRLIIDSSGVTQNTDIKEIEYMNGHIAKITHSIIIKNGTPSAPVVYSYSYDSKGNLSYKTTRYTSGAIDRAAYTNYDDFGRPDGLIFYQKLSSVDTTYSLTSTIKNTYDGAGNLLQADTYVNNQVVASFKSTYWTMPNKSSLINNYLNPDLPEKNTRDINRSLLKTLKIYLNNYCPVTSSAVFELAADNSYEYTQTADGCSSLYKNINSGIYCGTSMSTEESITYTY